MRSRKKTTTRKPTTARKPAAPAKVEAQVIAPYGSDDYFAAWDAAETDELVEAILAWNTGEGTVESPWHPIPDADTIAAIRQHEADGQNRDIVLTTIDVKAEELAAQPPRPPMRAATYDVVGVDGRNIERWLSKSAAAELAQHVIRTTGEKVKVKPSRPREDA